MNTVKFNLHGKSINTMTSNYSCQLNQLPFFILYNFDTSVNTQQWTQPVGFDRLTETALSNCTKVNKYCSYQIIQSIR